MRAHPVVVGLVIVVGGLALFSVFSQHASQSALPLSTTPQTQKAPSQEVTSSVPAWRNPLPGTAGFLGTDGGGSDTATVCDSIQHWHEWLDAPFPEAVDGCSNLPMGLPVVIRGLASDEDSATAKSTTTVQPLVEISIPSKGVDGWVPLLGGVRPVVPTGTAGYFKQEGNEILRLAPAQDSNDDVGSLLGATGSLTVLRYDPKTDARSLYVKITSGLASGQSGWIDGLGVSASLDKDADSVTDFHGEIKELSSSISSPFENAPLQTPSTHYWQGENGWEVAYGPVPGGTGNGCTANQESPSVDHQVILWWDHTDLMVGFVGPAPDGAVGVPTDETTITMSVDRHTFFQHPDGFGDVVDIPQGGRVFILPVLHLSWDQNNEGHDTGLETGEVFNLLDRGHRLTTRVYDRTYTNDLKGFKSVHRLFEKCLNYSDD